MSCSPTAFYKTLLRVLLLLVTVLLVSSCSHDPKPVPAVTTEKPNDPIIVIHGVKDVYEFSDTATADEIRTSLLSDVYAAETSDTTDAVYPVTVTIYAMETDEVITNLTPGEYRLLFRCNLSGVPSVEAKLIVRVPDTTPPVITGATDKTATVGETVSYRTGITVTDDTDETVALQVDASGVDLTKPGNYLLTYSATDSSGNQTSVTVTVIVLEAQDPDDGNDVCTKEELDTLCYEILDQILEEGMTDREKAEAIFNRAKKITYVGTSDKSSWVAGAYVGLTYGRGDCFNYFAASKALLTLAGIPNYDLQRVGGKSDHYWQLVYIDGGWYHFDACPHPNDYPISCFLLTESEVREYTEWCTPVRKNYYVYDYENCPYEVVQDPQ